MNILGCGLTSNIRSESYSVIITPTDVEIENSLRYTSRIKVDALVSIEQALIIKTIARLKPDVFKKVTTEIMRLIEN